MNTQKRIITIILSFVIALGIFPDISQPTNTMAATGINMQGTTIKTYAYSNSNFPIYNRTSRNKTKIGTCYGKSDLITIHAVGTDGWSTVTIPVTGTSKTKTGYCLTSYLFQNINFSGSTGTVQVSDITTYRKSDCSVKYGTTTKGDSVFILGSASGNTQILYPCGSYYKAAWIKGQYMISNGKLQAPTTSVNSSNNKKQLATIQDGYYRIRSSINNSQVLDIDRGSKADCANLQLCQYNGGLNQLFHIKKNKDGYYTIQAVHSNMALDVYSMQRGMVQILFNHAIMVVQTSNGYCTKQVMANIHSKAEATDYLWMSVAALQQTDKIYNVTQTIILLHKSSLYST